MPPHVSVSRSLYVWRVSRCFRLIIMRLFMYGPVSTLPPGQAPDVFAFNISFRSGEVFTFICPSQEEKESWFSSLQVARPYSATSMG
jgi:hypothetical protein